MSEVGDFESFSAPAASEQSEAAKEAFREEMKRAQQARKQLQKEEGKAKKNDDKLAQIIVQFLGQTGGTELFLLISRCVAQNIPSELIIAVLSLIDRKASEEIVNILKEVKENKSLVVPEYGSINALNPAQKQVINEWIGHITKVATSKPHDVLRSVLLKSVNKKTQEVVHKISPSLIQLSAFIMRDYLAMQQTQIEVKRLQEFMQTIYVRLLQSIEELIKGQKQLDSQSA